ncbi:MAG: acetylglutamate kinase [Myxococcales bacterium]|nr:acetylglutamate kinase [Myxococcales bacterium]
MSITRDTLVKLLSNLGNKKEVEQYLRHYCSGESQRYAVVKIGGSVLFDQLDTVAASIAFLHQVGLMPIVLHGPGARLDPALAEAGLASPRKGGLRVVSVEALDVIRRVSQAENLALVEALEKQGCDCRPITSGVFEAEPLDLPRYGFLGGSANIDDAAVVASVRAGKLPVLTSLGSTRGGQLVYLNADMAARALARRFQPAKVIILTPAGGLVDEKGEIISAVNLAEDYERIMAQPWLDESSRIRLEQIHGMLHELPAESSVSLTLPDNLARELFTHRGAGTLVRRGERVVCFEGFEDIDRLRLQQLLESCFGRSLLPGYFDEKNFFRVYLTEDYRATAILTREAELPYLDKFGVTGKAQGEGLGSSVWTRMRQDNQKLFWRSQTVNDVNSWYFQQSEGSYRTPKWTVFWYGMQGFEEIERCVRTALALPPSLKDHGVASD